MSNPDDGREVVEIVARALWEKDYPPQNRNIMEWDQLAPGSQRIWKGRAHAALTAIETSGRWRIVPVEPTDEIVGVLKSPIYGPLNPQTVAVSLEEGRQRWHDALSASPKATHTAEEGK